MYVFDHDRDKDHPVTERDRLIVARLDGIALRHAGWREQTEAESAAAVAELRVVAGGRADLLAEVAGLLAGFHEGNLDEPRAKGRGRLLHHGRSG